MAGDNYYYPYTKLLLQCNGANNSTTFADSSYNPKTILAAGDAKITTSDYKFGGAAATFDGTGDYLYYDGTHDDFKAGTDDFCFEAWIKTNSLASEQSILDFLTIGGNGGRNTALVLVLQTDGTLNFYTNSGYRGKSAGTISIGTWTKIAFARISGVFKYWIGGTLDANTVAYSVTLSTGGFVVGRYGDAGAGYFNGLMDDIRLTIGTSRYTATFTPETSELPAHNGQIAGNITESLGITKWRLNANRCSDGLLLDTVTTTGSTYTLDCWTGDAAIVSIAPHIDRAWTTGYTPATGEFWVPSNPDTTPHLFECTTSGAVGGTEPTWNTTPSATTSDGSAVWTCVGPLPTPKALGPRIPS